MSDDKTATDSDDAEILNKFNNLLGKYQNQGKITGAMPPHNVSATGKTTGSIPVLTEAVTLHPAIIHRQPARLTPVRQILDAALEETQIEMDAQSRKALARALEIRLTKHIK